MPRTVRLLTRARRYHRAVSAARATAPRAPGKRVQAPLPGLLRLAIWRLAMAAICAAIGLVWSLACLIRGDPIGGLLVAGIFASLTSALGGHMLDGPPS